MIPSLSGVNDIMKFLKPTKLLTDIILLSISYRLLQQQTLLPLTSLDHVPMRLAAVNLRRTVVSAFYQI